MRQSKARRFGNVRKLPSGRYQARWQGPDGFSHKAPETFETAKAAGAWLARQETAIAGGAHVDERDGARTFATFADQWKREHVHNRASTITRDNGYLDWYVLPRFGPMAVSSITPAEIAAWLSDLKAAGREPATIRKAAQLARRILDLAVRDRSLLENPARLVKLPAPSVPDMRCLTLGEIDRLADSIDARYRALVVVGCHTGLRIGELAALTAADVDLLRRRLTVTRNVAEVGGHLHHGAPKTAASTRTVPLSREAVDALTPLVGQVSHRDDLLFPAPEGGYLRRSSWRTRFWVPAIKAAGLDGLRVHDLRHTAVSLWLAAGVDPKAIAAWAGHASVAFVLDRYGHLQPDHADAYLARLDAMVAAGRADNPKRGIPASNRYS